MQRPGSGSVVTVSTMQVQGPKFGFPKCMEMSGVCDSKPQKTEMKSLEYLG